MKTTVSYSIELLNINKLIKPTVDIFRDAVTYLIKVYEKEYDTLNLITQAKERFNSAEHLVHNTKYNVAKYNFDELFYKMPSYMRRNAIQKALGIVSSYKSNYQNWLNEQKGNKPSLQYHHHAMPTFYDKNMSLISDNLYIIYLKLFIEDDYKFVPVKLKKTDKDYIIKHCSDSKMSCPTLEKRYGKYYLRFCFEVNTKLNDTPLKDKKVCAIDLGINTDAVLSVMKEDGTILNRKFINFKSEKDHLYHVLNRIKRFQREGKGTSKLWRYAKNINDNLASKIANEITTFAYENNVDVIVFEYLDIKGKKRGSKKQKLHMWNKIVIQEIVESKAHRLGIRISHICAKNTSKLAFDGSGDVIRDNKKYSLCCLSNGKQYNCDLSASYNIGARYFIREKLKPLPEMVRLELEAKVPSISKRTTCTLNSLLEFNKYCVCS